ncbi:MAG: hypothetical protein LBF27_02050 [Sphingobacterium sp.]|jgi:DNA repair exonuclease SbcCD ATPase subunit|nr:hypothetical protein [Sphingobacterium sp.]
MSNFGTLLNYYDEKNISKIEELEIYKCIKVASNDRPYRIDYIDFTDSWTKENLYEFIGEILNKDYYSQENGYLQWNFYYYFISDEDLIAQNTLLIKEIVDNENYARKRVLTIESFNNYQDTLNAISDRNMDMVTKDLKSSWIQELKSHELEFVYDFNIKDIKKAVINYIDGNLNKHPQIDEILINNSETETVPLEKISELQIVNYREFPKKREYQFGNVVLGYGPNASGKTSFLDAIELAITGECSRGEEHSNDYEIRLVDSRNINYSYPDYSKSYIYRDNNWYRNNLGKSNLNSNFNRFNYFTSDAVYDLKRQDDNIEYDLEQIITDIALGPDVNQFEDRIKEFATCFEDQLSEIRSNNTKTYIEINIRETEIKSIQEKNTEPIELKEKFIKLLKNKSWFIPSSKNIYQFIKEAATQIQIIEDNFRNLDSLNIPANDLNKAEITKLFESTRSTSIKIRENKRELFELRTKLRNSHFEKDNILEKLDIYKKLIRYYRNPNFLKLKGLDNKIKEVSDSLKHTKNQLDHLRNLKVTEAFFTKYSRYKIEEIRDVINKRRQEVKSAKLKAQKKIQELEGGIGRLEEIITDIKGAGKEYINLYPNSTGCPLCGTEFKNRELINAIETVKSNFLAANLLQDIKKEREQYRTEESVLEFESEIINELMNFLSIYSQSADIQLLGLVNLYQLLDDEFALISHQKIELDELKAEFEGENLIESDFLSLESHWDTLEPKKVKTKNPIKVEKDLVVSLEKVNEKISILNETIDKIEIKLENSYKSNFTNDFELSQLLFILENAMDIYKTVGIYLDIENQKNVHDYLKDVAIIRSNFDLFKESFMNYRISNDSILELRETISDKLKELGVLKLKELKIIKTYNNIKNTLVKFNRKQFLGEYISQNKREIVQIYNLIHSPNEFNNIEIDNNKLYLSNSYGKRRNLNEISTGQRTALALAIFLCLNKKLYKGPNILLLDDPIAYVDDLNVLSFLDYLRELVLKSGKQIIFVTANSDLAFLFKMKFSFLNEDDFTIIRFKR